MPCTRMAIPLRSIAPGEGHVIRPPRPTLHASRSVLRNEPNFRRSGRDRGTDKGAKTR